MPLKIRSVPKTIPYSENLALLVCYHIAMGGTMLEASHEAGLPSDMTLYQWLFDYPDFGRAYDRAQEIKARRKFEELGAIARAATPENVNVARLVIDTEKWALAKMLPRIYGDKATTDLNITMSLEQLVLASIKLRDEPEDDDQEPRLSGRTELLAPEGQKRARGNARGPKGIKGHWARAIEHQAAEPEPTTDESE